MVVFGCYGPDADICARKKMRQAKGCEYRSMRFLRIVKGRTRIIPWEKKESPTGGGGKVLA